MTTSERVPVDKLDGITYHIWRPLQEAGLNYVDQVVLTSTERLHEIIPTQKSFRSLLKAIGREEEIVKIFGEEPIAVDGQTLDMAPIRALAGLRGTYRYFRFDSAEELKAALQSGKRKDAETGKTVSFGWVDIARYKLERDAIKTAAQVLAGELDAPENVMPSETAEQLEVKLEERMADYARDYDTSLWTTSERKTLRWLAASELRIEMLQNRQMMGDPGSESTAKQRSEEIDRLLNQVRKLRDDLQITLKARIEAGRQTASEDVIKSLALNGKRLLAERASLFQHCGILQGIFLPNFPAHVDTQAITVRCCRCGVPMKWQLITKEMLDLYTEADSFVPADAPPGMFAK